MRKQKSAIKQKFARARILKNPEIRKHLLVVLCYIENVVRKQWGFRVKNYKLLKGGFLNEKEIT